MPKVDQPGKVFAFPLEIVVRAFEIEADDDLLAAVRSFADSPLRNLPEEAQKLVNRSVSQFNKALSSYDSAEDKKLWRDYLDASYADLFLGVSPSSRVPIQSVYQGRDNLLYDKAYFAVKKTMDEAGWKKPVSCREPEDHIYVEWKFFQNLLVEDPSGAKAVEFKEAHFDQWMDEVLPDLIEGDEIGFYAGIAYLARAILVCMSE